MNRSTKITDADTSSLRSLPLIYMTIETIYEEWIRNLLCHPRDGELREPRDKG
jgi:hypothetical protein